MKRFFTLFALAAGLLCSLPAAGAGRLFATLQECEHYNAQPASSLSHEIFAAIRARVQQRAMCPGLTDPSATTQWWHHVSEYMTDAAIVHVFEPSPKTDAWLHDNVMALVRRPLADWSGPAFRRYYGGVMRGSLETGHLCWAVGICLDTAADLFTPAEVAEIKENLREKGLKPCRVYLDTRDAYTNWNCIMLAGYAVAAAILEDEAALDFARNYFDILIDHYQADGSYGETLQYGNYATYALVIAHETLLRCGRIKEANLEPYGRYVEWAATAFFFRKPMSGWPIPMNLPRSANFGDCAAVYRPSGDVLMHIAVRGGRQLPDQAALASWIFDQTYLPIEEPAVHDMASFGFINDFGFLSVLFAADRAAAKSPADLGLATVRAFSAGDSFLRERWGAKTAVAFRIPPEPRNDCGHQHADMGSIIVAHGNERLLVDPGHSCYRNTTRVLDVRTENHNTCTFVTQDGRLIDQKTAPMRRMIMDGDRRLPGEKVFLGGERLLCAQSGEVGVVGMDAAPFYGAPIRSFRRFVVLCGSNVLFVIDHFESDEPVRSTSRWMLNNRDGGLDFRFGYPDALYGARGNSALKMMRFGTPGSLTGPIYGLVHDAYHPLPRQFCEGRPGSGYIFSFVDNDFARSGDAIYPIAIDSRGCLDGWEIAREGEACVVSNAAQGVSWSLSVDAKGGITLREKKAGRSWAIRPGKSGWTLK